MELLNNVVATLWDQLLGIDFTVIPATGIDCLLSEAKLYCHGPSTELVLHREIKCTVSFIRRVLLERFHCNFSSHDLASYISIVYAASYWLESQNPLIVAQSPRLKYLCFLIRDVERTSYAFHSVSHRMETAIGYSRDYGHVGLPNC